MAVSYFLCCLLALCGLPNILLAQDAQDGFPELIVLMTERHSLFRPGLIYSVTLHHKNYTLLSLPRVVTPAAIDYDKINKRVYWTDISTEQVRSADLDGGNDKIVASLNNVTYPEGLAVDDDVGKIFYTDRGNQVIVRIEVNGFNSTTIVNSSLDAPWGIVADKKNKKLYWLDHGNDTIESCDYDGNGRRIVASDDIYAPTGIALNENTGRLYWCQYNGEVKSILTNGTVRLDHISRKSPIRRFMDIALFNGLLYITDRSNNRIIVFPESGGEEISLSSRYFGNLNGIHVFSPNSIETGCPDGKYGVGCNKTCGKCRDDAPCEKTVGVCLGGCDVGYQGPMCKDVCDDGFYGYRCSSTCGHCKTGTTCHHLTGDCPSGCDGVWTGIDCRERDIGPELMILLTERHSATRNGIIYKLRIHHMNFTSMNSRNVITPAAIDYDSINKRVYWTDISSEQVRSADLDGDNDRIVASLNNISYPEGLAVDAGAGVLFYTDRGNKVIKRIEINNNFNSTTIVNSSLDTPWGIVADKKNKKLYWVDHGSDKIESCDYNGGQRRTVTATGVYAATGIAINEKTGRLYWCEYSGEVNSILTNGSGRREVIAEATPIRRYMDISIFNGFLYLTDRTNSNITVVPEEGGTEMRLSASRFGNLNGIHVFSPNTNETACPDGKTGVGCSIVCGNCSRGTACEKTVGVCLAGCAPGYIGELCTDTCPSGFYGKKCISECGYCRAGTTCHHETGSCPSGCQSGWNGNTCKIPACKPGYYGKLACLPCGQCKSGEACDINTGKCPSGCQAGWNGTNCQGLCSPGTYGDGCAMKCGACIGSIACDRVTGACPFGCNPGWTGRTCSTSIVCTVGRYGPDCRLCGNCKTKTGCNRVTGSCPSGGCLPNWKGVRCDIRVKECHAGYYGPSCLSQCGHCKTNTTCHSLKGTCPNGCKLGWKGSICKLKCSYNTYGDGCNRECGYCAVNTTCDSVTGVCPKGCLQYWTGDKCQTDLASANAQRKTSAANVVRRRCIDALGIVMFLFVVLIV